MWGGDIDSGYSTPPRQGTAPVNDPDVAWDMIKTNQKFSKVPTVSRSYDPSNFTRIACISDTHGKHRRVLVPQCDVLIHGGDFSQTGEPKIIKDLNDYFGELIVEEEVVKEVICIAGNHDLTFQPETYPDNWQMFHRVNGPYDTTATRNLLSNCTYLEDATYNSTKTHDKINYYGSPWQPDFGYNWAFNLPRDKIHKKWDMIPDETDVLITHGPPLGRGDFCRSGNRAGCLDLLRQVQNRICPRVHIFGHIHEDSGVSTDGTTLFVNASSCNLQYKPNNLCIVIDVPHDLSLPAQVVKPQCTLTGEELLSFLRTATPTNSLHSNKKESMRNYHILIPFFEAMNPLLEGKDLMSECNGIDTIDDSRYSIRELGCRLQMHREKNWSLLEQLLQDLIMNLRIKSY